MTSFQTQDSPEPSSFAHRTPRRFPHSFPIRTPSTAPGTTVQAEVPYRTDVHVCMALFCRAVLYRSTGWVQNSPTMTPHHHHVVCKNPVSLRGRIVTTASRVVSMIRQPEVWILFDLLLRLQPVQQSKLWQGCAVQQALQGHFVF